MAELHPGSRISFGRHADHVADSSILYVPRDSSAVSLGADAVADAIRREAASRKLDVKIVRNGSRGMFSHEPMVEVATGGGRIAYGPVAASDVASTVRRELSRRSRASPAPRRRRRNTVAQVANPADVRARGRDRSGVARRLHRARRISRPRARNRARRRRGYRRGHQVGSCAAAAARDFRPASSGRPRLTRRRTPKYVVCNADEGDSGTFSDRMIMEGDPFVLIEGMTIAALAVGATQGYIYLRSEYPHARRALTEAIATAYSNGYLGREHSWHRQVVRAGDSPRRRRVHLRRGNRDARKYRGPPRDGPLQAADSRDRRTVRQADPDQQRGLVRDGADHHRARRGIFPRLRRRAIRAARYRFNSPATRNVPG